MLSQSVYCFNWLLSKWPVIISSLLVQVSSFISYKQHIITCLHWITLQIISCSVTSSWTLKSFILCYKFTFEISKSPWWKEANLHFTEVSLQYKCKTLLAWFVNGILSFTDITCKENRKKCFCLKPIEV